MSFAPWQELGRILAGQQPPHLLNYYTPDQLLDAIWILDQQSDQNRRVLGQLVAWCVGHASASLAPPGADGPGAPLISFSQAKERLDPSLLEQSGIIQSAVLWTRKQVRLNTNLYYKQQRFNLYREEPEGYARLLCLLSTSGERARQQVTKEALMEVIAVYDLDPHRVIEALVLACAMEEQHGGDAHLLGLLKVFDYPSYNMAALVGFQLLKEFDTDTEGKGEDKEQIEEGQMDAKPAGRAEQPQDPARHDEWMESLFDFSARCIKDKMFELEDLLPYMETEMETRRPFARQDARGASGAMPNMMAVHSAASEQEAKHAHLVWMFSALIKFGLFGEARRVPLELPIWNARLNQELAKTGPGQAPRAGRAPVCARLPGALRSAPRAPAIAEVIAGIEAAGRRVPGPPDPPHPPLGVHRPRQHGHVDFPLGGAQPAWVQAAVRPVPSLVRAGNQGVPIGGPGVRKCAHGPQAPLAAPFARKRAPTGPPAR